MKICLDCQNEATKLCRRLHKTVNIDGRKNALYIISRDGKILEDGYLQVREYRAAFKLLDLKYKELTIEKWTLLRVFLVDTDGETLIKIKQIETNLDKIGHQLASIINDTTPEKAAKALYNIIFQNFQRIYELLLSSHKTMKLAKEILEYGKRNLFVEAYQEVTEEVV